MQKSRPLLLLTGALIVALITSLMAYNWLIKKANAKEANLQLRPVAVAAADLPWGTALNKDMLKTTQFLKGSLSEAECFADIAALEGKVLIMPVKANEPILRSRLAPDSIATGGVAAVVDPNKRAMAVKVDKVIGVSGFVHPGNRVDVLVSLQKVEKNSNPITKIVLQNIPVLATGTEIEQKGRNEKPVQVDVITLELTPEQAEKLALATSEGKIQLALRNYNSSEQVSTRGETISSLLSGNAPASKAAVKNVTATKRQAHAAVQTVSMHVEILRGKDKTTKTFAVEQ